MSRNRNYPDNYNERRSSEGSWNNNYDDNRNSGYRNNDNDDSRERSYGSTYHNQTRNNDRDSWREDNNRYRSNYRDERNSDNDNFEDNEFGYGGNPYPEYKYARGMWGPVGYGIAMGNYEGRPHYAQSGREYAQSGREYISRDELEERNDDWNNDRYSGQNRNWNNERNTENRNRNNDRGNFSSHNRNRNYNDDDKNVFGRMGEGIRDTWNDMSRDSYNDNDRNRYRDNDYNRYRPQNNERSWNRNSGLNENPYMRNTPEGYGGRGSSQYGTQRQDRGRGYSSREELNNRHSYNRDNNDWEY